ncbi:unnamed protein product [Trifolium pratense]|uniref:Uncharacterized protein n=1 Tax=Trifolium pratense TaxID=57577 RepID=A0ACB0KRA3_TRIPR|nr:unnamed protein product [Trifolium pratense]
MTGNSITSRSNQTMQLPCDYDGHCMVCKQNPPNIEISPCRTCATPWHILCLPVPPTTFFDWDCPDCCQSQQNNHAPPLTENLISAIQAIQSDISLTEVEKAIKRQKLVGGSSKPHLDNNKSNGMLDIFDGTLNCSFCMQLLERPITTPCGHNFCLRCFEKWIGKGKHVCAKCRSTIPSKIASHPRINSQLAIAIRLAKLARSEGIRESIDIATKNAPCFMHNDDRPNTAFTTERAKKAGKANACCGKIFVTIPSDHFGPILAENDPIRNRGVVVGDTWSDRMECRQWGAHFPHVAGIAGQSNHGSQSVALSGGYIDDEDHGEWFLYTGSGGRDLSGNKRINKQHSFDQTFDYMNQALRISCLKGYPVRVVRSHKEKCSFYAPEVGVRYDGIYRIEKCWRKNGIHGHKVCRYLFVRCDNEPAPWTSDLYGDRPRPLPKIKELKDAIDITERKGVPSWDYDEEKGCWLWKKPPPKSKKKATIVNSVDGTIIRDFKPKTKKVSLKLKARILKEFGCNICRKVLVLPLTTPCAHNFCKTCLEDAFSGQSYTKKRIYENGRTLRSLKNIIRCPSCSNDIADFLQNPQVNREMMDVIESLQRQTEQMDGNSEELSDDNAA